MTRAARWALALSASAVALASCGAPKPVIVDFSAVPRDYRSQDYQSVYERWTRHTVARRELEAVLEVWATYESWDFREAYVEHYASIYNLSDADKNALRSSQLETFKTTYEFHVTAQSTAYKWNDLERRNSAWRITLVDGLGRELAVESVRILKLPETYSLEFFPEQGPFTRTYSIIFTRPVASDGKPVDFVGDRSGSLTLRIASPIGRVDLLWQGS